jgi:hypothetical protein
VAIRRCFTSGLWGSLLVQALAFGRRSVEGPGPIPGPHEARRDGEHDRDDPRRGKGSDAPWAPTTGRPIAVPRGVETMTNALRAASTDGRFAVVVADWNRECVTGMNGP